jgi:hypothetical protein
VVLRRGGVLFPFRSWSGGRRCSPRRQLLDGRLRLVTLYRFGQEAEGCPIWIGETTGDSRIGESGSSEFNRAARNDAELIELRPLYLDPMACATYRFGDAQM